MASDAQEAWWPPTFSRSPEVIGVMDGPGEEPAHLALQLTSDFQALDGAIVVMAIRILSTGWKVLAFGSPNGCIG